MASKKRYWSLGLLVMFMLGIGIKTSIDVTPVQTSLQHVISDRQAVQLTDRNGVPLTASYQQRWNSSDVIPLYHVPPFLRDSFIRSEDKRFYDHHGVDWQARGSALWQNIRAWGAVRGASTITEQVVRMLTPRPRNLWSKWIEGWEAMLLEKKFSKHEILEFYLNQLPYASHRRGVVQAARYYFNRDISTLNKKEMLVLVVLARAPSGLDLYKNPKAIEAGVARLTKQVVPDAEQAQVLATTLDIEPPALPVNASHFVSYIRKEPMMRHTAVVRTTLDAVLQQKIQHIIDTRVAALRYRKVHNAAVLVVDHESGEILAWVVAGAESGGSTHPTPGYKIDAVTTPRQPGSALKPFLYTRALEKGWTASTLIDDSPFYGAVGAGLHRFRNYSNTFYGPITLREALANSLNIPALKTIHYVGVQPYLETLHRLGFASLDRGAMIYDEGLALGNGEVTLLELVRAYTALAHRGIYRPLSAMLERDRPVKEEQVFSAEAASLMGNILLDTWARRLEFGANSVLNLPVQTATKTGTSTDYRDAWAVGYNYRYTVGVWMGNLDQTPMEEVTGSTGPALALRSVFSELTRYQKTQPLYLSPQLVAMDSCVGERCLKRTEYYIMGTEPGASIPQKKSRERLVITQPTENLHLAIDPRIPRERQQLELRLAGTREGDQVEWRVDDGVVEGKMWTLEYGKHKVNAVVTRMDGQQHVLQPVGFVVK